MEDNTDFQDWELLHDGVDVAAPPTSGDAPKGFDGFDEGGSDVGIKHDYFSLDSDKRGFGRAGFEEDSLAASVAESDNPSWVEPGSASAYYGEPRGEPVLARLWTSSEESSDEQKSLADSENGEVGLEGVEVLHKNCEENGSDLNGNRATDVREGYVLGETGLVEGVESNCDSIEELGYAKSTDLGHATESAGERVAGNGSSGELPVGNGEKSVLAVLWKLPLELVKFCVFKVRPVWSISIAAAMVGFVMLGRKLYKMKRKSPSIPLKVGIDDKKTSPFVARAARLNEAFSAMRRVPLIKAPLPATGITPWPVMALR